MPDDLSVAVERLRTSTQRLNAVSDAAAKTVRDTEAFLEQLGVGVCASVLVKYATPSGAPDEYDEVVSLAYARYKTAKFRIVLTYTPAGAQRPSDDTIRAWAECSRDDKLDSFEKLPDLLIELAKKVDERTAKAEQTIATVNSLIQLPTKPKGA